VTHQPRSDAVPILISERDLIQIKRLPLSERQRLIGLCVELCLTGRGASIDPLSSPQAAQGWLRVAQLSDEASARAHEQDERWWWRPVGADFWLHYGPQAPELRREEAELTVYEPVAELIRSPEQATLRRLLLTDSTEVSFVDAPWGCGLSWGLSLAIADYLREREGELLFISAQASTLRTLITEQYPEGAERLHVYSLDELLTQPALASLSLREFSALCHQVSASLPPHPWLEALPLLKLLWERRAGREASLQGLAPDWRESALELFKRLDEASPSGAARPERGEGFSWAGLSCVVIDDATLSPYERLRALLYQAQQALGERRRGWRLILAGREWGAPHGLSVTWRALETLCEEELGREVRRYELTQSERLTRERLTLIKSLSALDPRPWVQRPRRQELPALSHKPLTHNALASLTLCPIEGPLSDHESRGLLESLEGTPNAALIDLSRELSLCELSAAEGGSSRSVYAGDALFTEGSLSLGEASPYVIYAPNGLISAPHERERLPEQLRQLSDLLESQALRVLLSRAGGRVYLLGQLGPPCLELLASGPGVLKLNDPSALRAELDALSPWGGAWVSQTRREARAALSARDWARALELWRGLSLAAGELFDDAGRQELKRALSSLYRRALTESIEAGAWRQAATLLEELPGELSEPLDDDQSLSLKVRVKTLIAEAQEAHEKAAPQLFERSLAQLSGLASLEPAHALYEQLRAQLWAWSAAHLLKAVPQAPLQSLILRHLCEQEPARHSYQALLRAYELQPQAVTLCALAHELLTFPEGAELLWSMRHLRRWAQHLDRGLSELLSQSPESGGEARGGGSDPFAELALFFATVSARERDWTLSQRLLELGVKRSAALSSLQTGPNYGPNHGPNHGPNAESQGDAPASSPALIRLREALSTALRARGLSEERSALRALGELKGLEESYSAEPPPPNLQVAFELRRSLERARGLWHSLTPAEQRQLQRAWELVMSASPNPRWGLESLSPLESELPQLQAEREGSA